MRAWHVQRDVRYNSIAEFKTARPLAAWGAARWMCASSLILLTSLAFPVHAQTLTTLLSFDGTNGMHPYGDLTLNGSTLYGITSQGGSNYDGTIFRINTDATGFQSLLSFSGSNGANPQASLTLSGSSLYGTAELGGTTGYGTVFTINTDGTGFQILTNDVYDPSSTLVLSGSTLYGTAGSIFSIPVSGGTPTTLLSFNGTNGSRPLGSLTISPDGSTVYGMTLQGGAKNIGTVYRVNTDGTGFQSLLSFDQWFYGAYPFGGLTLSADGSTLYGMTSGGGPGNYGTIFSVPVDGGTPTALLWFNRINGRFPEGSLTLSGSTLYGMTQAGGANDLGTLFRVNTDGSGFETLLSFSGTNGAYPHGSLTLSGSILYGMTSEGGANDDGTVFALSIAPASVGLASLSNATIISGGTATPGMVVSNSPSSGYSLNYTMTAAVVSGSASLSPVIPATGSLAPSASQSCTVSVTSTALGVNTLSFTASDPNSSNLCQSATATLTVYDHSNASLSSSATQTTQTINFGNVLRGANAPSQAFTVYNLAANTTANYTANLKLTGFSSSGDSAFSTNLAAFGGLTAASGSNGNTFTASLNTANYTASGTGSITMSASQLVDDSSLPGAGNNNNGGLTVALVGNVGNAAADASNSPNTFGPALSAQVAAGGSYGNLESTVNATSVPVKGTVPFLPTHSVGAPQKSGQSPAAAIGGGPAVGTTATILAGTNSSGTGQTVNMQWRTRTTGADAIFASDVLNLSGLSLDGSGSGQTAPYVLQMSYNAGSFGADEATLAAEGQIDLLYLDPNTGLWGNAIDGNFGVNAGDFHDAAWRPGDLTLGDWGVNTANHTVWAVLNHDSQFAVVPEPSTLALLGITALGLIGCSSQYGRRPRQRATIGSQKSNVGKLRGRLPSGLADWQPAPRHRMP